METCSRLAHVTEFDDRSQTAAEPWAWTRIKQGKAINVIETRGCLRWPEMTVCIT